MRPGHLVQPALLIGQEQACLRLVFAEQAMAHEVKQGIGRLRKLDPRAQRLQRCRSRRARYGTRPRPAGQHLARDPAQGRPHAVHRRLDVKGVQAVFGQALRAGNDHQGAQRVPSDGPKEPVGHAGQVVAEKDPPVQRQQVPGTVDPGAQALPAFRPQCPVLDREEQAQVGFLGLALAAGRHKGVAHVAAKQRLPQHPAIIQWGGLLEQFGLVQAQDALLAHWRQGIGPVVFHHHGPGVAHLALDDDLQVIHVAAFPPLQSAPGTGPRDPLRQPARRPWSAAVQPASCSTIRMSTITRSGSGDPTATVLLTLYHTIPLAATQKYPEPDA